ncbi:MAG: peptidase M14 family protein, partial [Candidatus Aminicenantales bacterium]
PEGSFLISLAQPKMGLIRNLLGRTLYPDNAWTRDREGNPLRPYDLATHTMNEFMGVRVDPVDEVVGGEFHRLSGQIPFKGRVSVGKAGCWMDGRLNDSYKAANLLLERGADVWRVDKAVSGLRPGDFLVLGSSEEDLQGVAEETGVDFMQLETKPKSGIHRVQRLRVGMYQRYWGGNMDEGWTRFLLEQFDFPYTTLRDDEIKNGNLVHKYDVIILPHDSPGMIIGEVPARYRRYLSAFPPEYRSGIGSEGVQALRTFVEEGGTLVTLGEACSFAIEALHLSVRNVVANVESSSEFFCPGSTLRVCFDTSHPLSYGMPAEGYVVFYSSPVFEVIPGPHNERYATVVRYKDKDILQSGWLIGEERIAKRAAMVDAAFGKGHAVLIGFRTQHRCQTHGTFKLLFNALLR